MSVWLEGSMLSHFGSFKKKSGRIWLCSFKRGFSLRGRAAERQKRFFSKQFLSPCFALSLSPSLCPQPGHLPGRPTPWSPRAREAQPLLRETQTPGPADGPAAPACPALPSLKAQLGGKWEEKGKAGMWLPEASEK